MKSHFLKDEQGNGAHKIQNVGNVVREASEHLQNLEGDLNYKIFYTYV